MKLDSIDITRCQLVNSTRTARIYRSNTYAIKCLALDYDIPPHNTEFEVSILSKVGSKCQHILPLLESKATDNDLLLLFPFEEMNLHEFMQLQYKRDIRKKNPYYDLLDSSTQTAAGSSVQKYTNQLDVNQYPLSFFSQIIEGVAFLHENKIIHRDIKPQNIMLTNNTTTQPPKLYIIDFGVSYDMGNKSQTSAEPMDSKVTDISTGIYKAPEVLFGVKCYDGGVDVWSLLIIVSQWFQRETDRMGHVPAMIDDGSDDMNSDGSDFRLICSIFEKLGVPSILKWEAVAQHGSVDAFVGMFGADGDGKYILDQQKDVQVSIIERNMPRLNEITDVKVKQKFVNCILGMVSFSPNERWSCQRILQELKKP
ncbi:cyclin-dependent protein kinase-activating kinase CAK1 [Saccharomyces paradoxus]|uniref:Cyclin-dependent protein kinase-activating kinase CAK1 n=1 Tax=Saccharomyces paradoxus TaxID=27291 RepID=A0A8B8UQL7_SACPA|nr:Cak1 [Saccharomyces paradoxus]QHS73006.1 Cak1 [Saccharomyces paradoxus]